MYIVTPNVTQRSPKTRYGIIFIFLFSIITTVPLNVALAVFSDSLRVLARAR